MKNKKQKQKMRLDPTMDPTKEVLAAQMDPLRLLEAYRVSKQGVEELQPFGIDKSEAIKVMAHYGDIWLAKHRYTKEQLKRQFESEINLRMNQEKRQRADFREAARDQGIPVDSTTSESEKEENGTAGGKPGQQQGKQGSMFVKSFTRRLTKKFSSKKGFSVPSALLPTSNQ